MKRIIFCLLYDRGNFMMSRNFRLQIVGNIEWLLNNYDFANVSRGLDEMMILDVSRGERNSVEFLSIAKRIAGQCFIPLTLGGGITSIDLAQQYLYNGADKVLINSLFRDDPKACQEIVSRFGRQCVIAGIDYKKSNDHGYEIYVDRGSKSIDITLGEWIEHVLHLGAGELFLQSINQDGTGMGLDTSVTTPWSSQPDVPCILVGGVGHGEHVIEGLKTPGVDAVATANLFNFVESAFVDLRPLLVKHSIDLPLWDADAFKPLKDSLAAGSN